MDIKQNDNNMIERLENFQQALHEKNQKRVRKGIVFLLVVPLVFLFLLFISNSSKTVFLVLWIVSLFALAIYLVAVEYIDYNLQEKINELKGESDARIETLVKPKRNMDSSFLLSDAEQIEAEQEEQEQMGKRRKRECIGEEVDQ